MKPTHNQWSKYLVLGSLPIALISSLQAATTFHFDGVTINNTNIDDSFGDNATTDSTGFTVSAGADGTVGTSDIDITWQSAGATDHYASWDGRGEAAQLDVHNVSWTFATSANTAVILESFDLDEWNGGGTMDIDWTVTGSVSGALGSGNWTRSTGGRDTIAPSITGAAGESLTLTFALNGGTASYVAVDNLVLDQISAVPEPTSAALLGLGLGAMAMRRRRS